MNTYQHRPGPFALGINPLSTGKAIMFFALLYCMGTLMWASLPATAGAALTDNAPLIATFVLPLGLILFRMLSRLLGAPWFAVVVIILLATVAGIASVALPYEEATALVYTSFPFVALAAALWASLLACIIGRPLTSRRLPSIVLHTGLMLALAGVFVSMLFRVNGYMSLEHAQASSQARLRDARLFLTDDAGRTLWLAVPTASARADRQRLSMARMADLSLQLLHDPGTGGGVLSVFAEDGQESANATLRWGGTPGTLELGESNYMVRFGPGVLELPFEVTLHDSGVQYYPASRLPRHFHADVTVEEATSGIKRNATLLVNHPLRVGGYNISLHSVDTRGAVLEISRDPGAGVLFLGGALAVAGFSWGLVKRHGRTS